MSSREDKLETCIGEKFVASVDVSLPVSCSAGRTGTAAGPQQPCAVLAVIITAEISIYIRLVHHSRTPGLRKRLGACNPDLGACSAKKKLSGFAAIKSDCFK